MASSFALSTKPRRVRRWRYLPRRKRSQPKTWNLNDSAHALFAHFGKKTSQPKKFKKTENWTRLPENWIVYFEKRNFSKDVRRSILKKGSKRSPTNHLRIRVSQDGETFIQPRDRQGPLWRIVQVCSRIRPQSNGLCQCEIEIGLIGAKHGHDTLHGHVPNKFTTLREQRQVLRGKWSKCGAPLEPRSPTRLRYSDLLAAMAESSYAATVDWRIRATA